MGLSRSRPRLRPLRLNRGVTRVSGGSEGCIVVDMQEGAILPNGVESEQASETVTAEAQ